MPFRFITQRMPSKLLKIVGVLFVLFSLLTAYMLHLHLATLMEERQEATRRIVNNAYHLVNYFYDKQERKEIQTDKAKIYAIESIRHLTVDTHGYFWIMDTRPSIIMHPIQPSLEGLDMTNYKGPDGKHLFFEMLKVARANKEGGFIEYQWTKPDDKTERLYPKISFIRMFEPWQWVVGSGVYIDDIENDFWNAAWVAVGLSLALLMFVLSLALTVSDNWE